MLLVFISQDKFDTTDTQHNQSIYPDVSYSAAKSTVQVYRCYENVGPPYSGPTGPRFMGTAVRET